MYSDVKQLVLAESTYKICKNIKSFSQKVTVKGGSVTETKAFGKIFATVPVHS